MKKITGQTIFCDFSAVFVILLLALCRLLPLQPTWLDFGPGQDYLHFIAKLLSLSISGFRPVDGPWDCKGSSKWNMSRYQLICLLMYPGRLWRLIFVRNGLTKNKKPITMRMVCFALICVDHINNSKWFHISLIIFRLYRWQCSKHMVARVWVESLW